MSSPKVVVVGSLHYDIMVQASDRPRKGETLAGRAWWPKSGGKGGNQAVAAARAGADVRMVGVVGDDHFGAALLANLAAAGVDRSGVRVSRTEASGMSVAIIDSAGDYGAVIVSGANLALAEADLPAAAQFSGTVLVLQNEIAEAANLAAARRARAAGARVILNAAPARPLDRALATCIDILVVNGVEAEMLGGGAVATLADARRAARTLSATVATVVVTAGGAGVAAHGPGIDLSLPAEPVEVQSTHGAGDCFVGVLAAHLAAGAALPAAIAAANAAAARLVATAESDRGARSATQTLSRDPP